MNTLEHRAGRDRRHQDRRGPGPKGRAASGSGPAAFILRLVALWLAGFLAIAFVPGLEHAVIQATVASVVPILSLLMPHVAHQGDYVQAAGASLQIISECTPLVPAVLLCGAIAAFPAAARLRALGVAAGLVLLWIYNVLRIVVLVAVLAYKPAIFDLIHVYLWQSVTIVLVAVLFAAWLRMTEANSTAKSAG